MERFLFKSANDQVKANNLLEKILPLNTFGNFHKFNPHRDFNDCVARAGTVIETEKGFESVPMNPQTKYNQKNNITKTSSNFIAGILIEILRSEGYDTFNKCVKDYFNDYVIMRVAGDPFEVVELLKSVIRQEVPRVPDKTKILSMKCIQGWDLDGDLWCEPPQHYRSDYGNKAAFTETLGWNYPKTNRFCKLESIWDHTRALPSMLWCIAMNVHPIKLLNYCGLWMTNASAQPEGFKIKNPVTQKYEIELQDEYGNVEGYEQARPRITSGWFYTFAKMIKDINWFDNKGRDVEYLSDEFIESMKCIVIDDFCELNGPEWQLVSGLNSCEKASDYYTFMGYRTINETMVKQLTREQVAKRKAKIEESEADIVTGNPLFDMELLNDE